MNLDQLDSQYRKLADDDALPYLCDQAEIRGYFNEAIREVCRRGRLLVTSDPSTGEVKSTADIQLISGSSGSISAILVGTTNIITNSVNFTVNLQTTSALLCNEINNTSIYSATINGNTITVTSAEGVGQDNNNLIPIVISSGNLVFNNTAFIGGVNGICKISLLPNKSTYAYSDKIIQIKRAELASTQKKIWSIDYRQLDNQLPSWKTKKGTPRYLVVGMDTGKFNVFNTPIAKDNILLSVTHDPLTELVIDTDVPVINERYHDKLVYWVLYKVYSKNDTQVKQLTVNLAKRMLNEFEAYFGTIEYTSIAEEQFQLIHAEFNQNGSY